MHVRLLFPKEYLAAEDLEGTGDVALTIASLAREELRTDRGEEDKWILHFQEMIARHERDNKQPNKRLVLNKTNAKTIAKLHGSETDDWRGKRIALYATRCLAFGEEVGCIRIRDRVPGPSGKRRAQERTDVPDSISATPEATDDQATPPRDATGVAEIVRRIFADMESAMEHPETLPDLRKRIDALPDMPDKKIADRALARMEKASKR